MATYSTYGNRKADNNKFHAKVNKLKYMTKEYIDVYEMAWLYDWDEEELEIFKAYIDEDIEKYESLMYTDEIENVRQRVYKAYKDEHCKGHPLTPDETLNKIIQQVKSTVVISNYNFEERFKKIINKKKMQKYEKQILDIILNYNFKTNKSRKILDDFIYALEHYNSIIDESKFISQNKTTIEKNLYDFLQYPEFLEYINNIHKKLFYLHS
jgi:predicted phosphoadenosine phosphosulfate sulfurtransferase